VRVQRSRMPARPMNVRTWTACAVGLTAPALLVSGCSGSSPPSSGQSPSDAPEHETAGSAAVWELPAGTTLNANSTTFAALVSRLGCAGGETGQVLSPDIRAVDGQVIVTFQVASLPEGSTKTCQSNKQVAYDVVLNEPLGDKVLYDGACLDGAPAAATSLCLPNGERYQP
jgi:hypothetical protein